MADETETKMAENTEAGMAKDTEAGIAKDSEAGMAKDTEAGMAENTDNFLVDDLMTREVITCPREAPLATVAAALARNRIHAVFVPDEGGKPIGVISDFDLLAGEWLADDPERLATMRTITAGEMMTSPVETITNGTTAARAAAHMQELHLSRLLVTDDNGMALGVISVSDLVAPFGEPSGMRACVRDVMSYAIVTCPPQTPLAAACRAMTERYARSIVVVGVDGEAIGVITSRDLLSLYQASKRDDNVTTLMAPPITCTPDASISAAADLMISREVHRLVVIDPDRTPSPPIGIVSSSDIIVEMAGDRSDWQ